MLDISPQIRHLPFYTPHPYHFPAFSAGVIPEILEEIKQASLAAGFRFDSHEILMWACVCNAGSVAQVSTSRGVADEYCVVLCVVTEKSDLDDEAHLWRFSIQGLKGVKGAG